MQQKIIAKHPKTVFCDINTKDIFVADFSQRSNHTRSVEVHPTLPKVPDGSVDMDCLQLENLRQLLIQFAIFDDSEFLDSDGNNIEHCECCLYPLPFNKNNWIAFIELKDCKPDNVQNYKKKVIRQIFDACASLRGMKIPCKNAYGIISCPQRKINFNDNILYSPVELLNIKRTTNINFIVTNHGVIIDNEIIRPLLH